MCISKKKLFCCIYFSKILFQKKAKGIILLDLVYQHIELVEKDYFGLQFTENGSIPCATNTEITVSLPLFFLNFSHPLR